MAAFQLTTRAKEDLKSIGLYTKREWGVRQRNIYLNEIDHTFKMLSQQPELGIACSYIRKGYYKFPINSHVIFYKLLVKNKLIIVRILHKNMDINTQLFR